jgi:hypothetical protein
LPRLFSEAVFSSELSRGERLIQSSKYADRILRGLNADQSRQLAGLLLDLAEAMEYYVSRGRSSQTAQRLAREADRRARKLSRKTSKLRGDLEGLRKYARRLHPLLGLRYFRAADDCLDILSGLREDPFALEVSRSLKAEYRPLENPRQLAMVELYWFFRHECGRSGHESEVRVAMMLNEFLRSGGAGELKYSSTYDGIESQGCAAVRLAVSRYRQGTTD